MERKNYEIPCIYYLYIHSKIAERSPNNVMKRKEIISYLAEWRIPKQIRIAIVKELEMMGLIEKIDRVFAKINKSDFEPENTTKIYQLIGIL